MYQGSCLCGDVHYTVRGELGPLSLCHCHKCQKANGSAFLAACQIDPDKFELSDDNGLLKSFESSPGVYRYFCSQCGSPIYSIRLSATSMTMRLRVGTLDTPLVTTPQAHFYYDDKVNWCELVEDEAPKYHAGIDSSLV